MQYSDVLLIVISYDSPQFTFNIHMYWVPESDSIEYVWSTYGYVHYLLLDREPVNHDNIKNTIYSLLPEALTVWNIVTNVGGRSG